MRPSRRGTHHRSNEQRQRGIDNADYEPQRFSVSGALSRQTVPARCGKLRPVILEQDQTGAENDGRVCLSNNAAERALRGIALGRKSWLFAGSDRGGRRAAAMYSLIVTTKMNDVDPQAWLADVLARIAEHPVHKLDELLPWNWRATRETTSQAA